MKQYRIRTHNDDGSTINAKWSEWRNIDAPFGDHDILTIQFNEPLTVKESEQFFKHFVDKV